MADTYGLTRDMADAIVKAVRADAQCLLLLPRISAFKVFGGIGHAGTARNFANAWTMGLADADKFVMDKAGFPEAGSLTREYWRRLGDRQACTGVAEATARVLTAAAGKPGYEFLVSAGPEDRTPSDPPCDYHTATAVTVTGGHVYVFDWHSTLDIGDPLIFPSPAAFKKGHGAVRYSLFWGWT
jgi:hypothetical protein